MYLTVRMDDITADMDWDKFYRFKSILDQNGVKPLIGIVPDNQDQKLHIKDCREDFFAIVKELMNEGWSVAQHGVNHVYETTKGGLFPLNSYSEFAGLPYEKQYKKIQEGKRLLEEKGISTTVFMAPAHTYDKNTLKALVDCGFSYITDGFGQGPYTQYGLTFLPISFSQKASFSRQKDGYSTIVFHTNMMQDKDFVRYEKLFGEYKDLFIPYSEYIEKTPSNRGTIGRVIEWSMAKAKHILVKILNCKK